MNIKNIKLEYKNVIGAGKQIHAHLGKEFMCVEFTMRPDVAQMIASEPWIQFPPQEWSAMIEEVFIEMVELFNAKHRRK